MFYWPRYMGNCGLLLASVIAVAHAGDRVHAETPQRKVEGSLPQVVSPLDDGRLTLFPETAKFFGQEIRINPDNFCIAWWSESHDYVTWDLEVPAAGKYEVWIQWAIADDQAGNSFVIQVGDQSLQSKVAKSGGWTSFGHESIGTLDVPAGKQKLLMRPDGKLQGELADIRAITLNPVGTNVPPTAPVFPAKTPAASLNAIQVHPAMQVELVASEPLLRDPIAIAWGADLKLWVVEMGDYPLGTDGKGGSGGRIKFLEDTNGDGEYDKATLFLENLSFPTGVLPWGKGLLVTCAPDIFYAEDTDGDGKADVRKTLVTGFPQRNQQHRVNGLRYGLDNWIYCANGDGGVGGETLITSTQTGQQIQLGMRDFRFHPDTGEIEPQSGPTQFGRNQDNWGNWFGSNNAQPLYHFALDEHYIARNPRLAPPDPRVHQFNVGGPFYAKAPLIAFHGEQQSFAPVSRPVGLGGACSGVIYRDELLGAAFAGNALVCDPVTNLVHRRVLEAEGLTFKSQRAEDEPDSEFFASTDPWTRPTMVQTGPDGALYLVDMYRLYIEHPQWINDSVKSHADLRAGNALGRIYRIYPRDSKPRVAMPINQMALPALVAALDSPSGWQRDTVQQRIVTENLQAAVPLLKKLFTSSKQPTTRLQALTTLYGLNAADDKLLLEALYDSHPGVRRWAVKMSESRLDENAELATAVSKLATDSDLKVVQQVAYSLGSWNHPEAGQQLAELIVHYPENPYLIASALSSAPGHEVEMLKSLFSHADKVDQALLSLVLANCLAPEDESFQKFAQAQLSPNSKLAASNKQFLLMASLLDDQTATQSDWVSQLAPQFSARARKILAVDSPAEVRSAAIRLLARDLNKLAEDIELLTEQLSPLMPLPVAEAAVDRLAELSEPQVGKTLVSHWVQYSPAMRNRVFEVLMARAEWSLNFLQSIQQDAPLATSLDATRQQRLMKHPADKVRQLAEKVLGSAQDPDRAKVIQKYADSAADQGNTENGKAVFKKNCSACHRLENVGHSVGPDLTALKEKSPESILEAILNPNRAVEDKFMAYNAVTADGRVLSGLVQVESGNSITLATAEGQKHVILRSQLEKLISTGRSLMPDGFEKTISPAAMTDLLTYLAQFNLQKQSAPSSAVVNADPSGTLHLLATQATLQGEHVGINAEAGCIAWMTEGEQAKWTITLAAAGEYDVHIEWAQIDELADNSFVIEAAGKKVSGKFASTHGWSNYKTALYGTLSLPEGRTVVTLQPGGPVKTELADIRQIKLVPRETNRD